MLFHTKQSKSNGLEQVLDVSHHFCSKKHKENLINDLAVRLKRIRNAQRVSDILSA